MIKINLEQALISDGLFQYENIDEDKTGYVERFGIMQSTSVLTEWFYQKGFTLIDCDNIRDNHSLPVEMNCIYHKQME